MEKMMMSVRDTILNLILSGVVQRSSGGLKIESVQFVGVHCRASIRRVFALVDSKKYSVFCESHSSVTSSSTTHQTMHIHYRQSLSVNEAIKTIEIVNKVFTELDQRLDTLKTKLVKFTVNLKEKKDEVVSVI